MLGLAPVAATFPIAAKAAPVAAPAVGNMFHVTGTTTIMMADVVDANNRLIARMMRQGHFKQWQPGDEWPEDDEE